MKHIYGPIPSRRLGRSLGISLIPDRTCNYSCTYCQLGRTRNMSNSRKLYYPVIDIINEFEEYLKIVGHNFDVVSIVGDGEPTLYSALGIIINRLKALINKPIAVITNGALLYDKQVRRELMKADLVLPTITAADGKVFKEIHRPFGLLKYEKVFQGLEKFSKEYQGQLWLELILLGGINDSREYLFTLKDKMKNIKFDKIYINTPIRPPAEEFIKKSAHENIMIAADIFSAICIDELVKGGFYSNIKNNYEAVLSICQRHPMTNFEIKTFLQARQEKNIATFFKRLENDVRVTKANFNGFLTYRVYNGV